MTEEKDAVFCLESGGAGDAILQLLLKAEYYFLCEYSEDDGVNTLLDVSKVQLDETVDEKSLWTSIYGEFVESEEKVDAHYYDADLIDFYSKHANDPCDDAVILDNFPFPEKQIECEVTAPEEGEGWFFWVFCFIVAVIILGAFD
jgi:hypothetical protein